MKMESIKRKRIVWSWRYPNSGLEVVL